MASAYRFFFSTLCRARNTDLGRHPTDGARRFGHVSWQKRCLRRTGMSWWHTGVSRRTEVNVRGMETGTESGEEEQDKQSTRARVTARWE